MKITSNPNDPEFRKALRELGAPDWYPQDAPRHIVTGSSENNEDGSWLSKLVCPICGWEKHIVSGDAGSMITINEGDKWAIHSGSTTPETFQIVGFKANPDHDQAEHQSSSEDSNLGFDDDYFKPFEDFLRKIE
jgi:hypothetical protein